MSSISTISDTVLKRTSPFCSHNIPMLIITKKTCASIINTPISQKSLFSSGAISTKKHVTRRSFPSLLMASREPPEYPTSIPPEIPFVPLPKHDPSIPLEMPPLTTSPEVYPGGAPSEVIENPPPYGPETRPEIEFPKPPVSPPPKPDVPPMPPGPDILPPDRPLGPEIDPPRTPPPDVPPVRPPAPEIVPPPNLPPPGSPFGDFGFTI